MSGIDHTLDTAKQLHQAGQIEQAEALYRQILKDDAGHVEAYCLLGLACFALGKLDEAAANLQRSVRIQPDYIAGHSYLGALYGAQGHVDESLLSFRRAWQLDPQSAQLKHDVTRAEAAQQNHLGMALFEQGQTDRAAACYRSALERDPEHADAHNNLGILLVSQQKLSEAAVAFRRALAIAPDLAAASGNLGIVAEVLGRREEATACFRRLAEQSPDDAAVQYKLVPLLVAQGKLLEAEAVCRRVLELQPRATEAFLALATVLKGQHRLGEAAAACRNAIQLRPDLNDAHVAHAMILLLDGQMAEGWREYEWRQKGISELALSKPRWTGASPEGRTILLCGEQGLGDTFQFIRYAQQVQQRGARLLFEVLAPLVPLIKQSGFQDVFARGTPLPDFDFHVLLMSLPTILGTTLNSVPASIPYLAADPALVAAWREKLGGGDKLRVGIHWQASQETLDGRQRTIPLAEFAPLAQDGVELISLQSGAAIKELAPLAGAFRVRDLGPEVDREHGAFMDTAAIMKNLDLVITCDSAVAHLAGGLGVPVWVALQFTPDWRWMLERADSPWYPTLRLFRQQTPGDWSGVFQDMAAGLARLAAGDRPSDNK